MPIVIEKNVPFDDRFKNTAEYYAAMSTMDVGDSFVVYGEVQQRALRTVIAGMKKRGLEQRFSMVKQKEPAGFWRIWRVI